MKYIFKILLLSCLVSSVHAQIDPYEKIYPKAKYIKSKYYNGSGNGISWSIKILDERGRVIENQTFRNIKLMSNETHQYNEHDDIIITQNIPVQNETKSSSTRHYRYAYDDYGNIRKQNDRIFLETDSNHIKILKTPIFNGYDYKRYVFNDKHQVITTIDTSYNTSHQGDTTFHKTITQYEYNKYGDKSRQKHIRNPESDVVWVGGIGGDDVYYEYKYDSLGRIKKEYRIVEGKKYLIVKSRYYTNWKPLSLWFLRKNMQHNRTRRMERVLHFQNECYYHSLD